MTLCSHRSDKLVMLSTPSFELLSLESFVSEYFEVDWLVDWWLVCDAEIMQVERDKLHMTCRIAGMTG